MNAKQFRAAHGSSATWTAADFDSFQVIAETSRKNRLMFRLRSIRRSVKRTLHLAA